MLNNSTFSIETTVIKNYFFRKQFKLLIIIVSFFAQLTNFLRVFIIYRLVCTPLIYHYLKLSSSDLDLCRLRVIFL